ncbi:hypothetical protein [Acaryochloris marina]|uniref:hypothetical protein n=1 Tax=Acaryochloris marina TaxID=155978 RepID=UPI001BB07BBC|nr:hypothetical protein [Acaryochloris marina]QUY40608.1 hypothetical protein I1H34_14855 [Acaryochloris marina S15]
MQEFYDNVTYYGIGKILKEYAGFPSYLPCPMSLQHGWTITATDHDARYDAPENWYWSKSLEETYKRKYRALKTRSIGAPFLYLLKLLDYSEADNKQGSIVFPSHSSKLIEMKCDFDLYAEMLQNLPDNYHPITVCMYHLDQQKGLDNTFRGHGFKVVTNGNDLYDKAFLKRFVANVHGKRYAFSNQMTSALLFASAMGLKSFFWGPRFSTDSLDQNYQDIDYTDFHRSWESRFGNFFSFPECDLKVQREIIEQELGNELVLSKSELGKLMLRLALSKKYLLRFLPARVLSITVSMKRLLRKVFEKIIPESIISHE